MSKKNKGINFRSIFRFSLPVKIFCAFALSILFVISLLPTPAFRLLGENTIQPALAQISEQFAESERLAAEPWKVVGGVKQSGWINNKYSEVLTPELVLDQDYVTTGEMDDKYNNEEFSASDNADELEDMGADLPPSEEELELTDRVNAIATGNGNLARYQMDSAIGTDQWQIITKEIELQEIVEEGTYTSILVDFLVYGESIKTSSRLCIPPDKSVTLNLHGCLFSRFRTDEAKSGEVIFIQKNSTLVVNGVSSEDEKQFKHENVKAYYDSAGHNEGRTVYGAVITGGYNKNGGGGLNVYGDNCNVTLNDVKVFGNRTNGLPYTTGGCGGNIRILCDHATIIMNNSELDNAYAENWGGGLCFAEGADWNAVYLNNSYIHENNTDDEGGGIAEVNGNNNIYGDAYNGDLEHGSFVQYNNAREDGGGFEVWYEDGDYSSIVSGVNFYHNACREHGGAVDVYDGIISFDNCNFWENYSTGSNGGAIFDDDECSLNNCYICDNRSPKSGGGVFVEENDDLVISGKIICENNHFTNGRECNIYLDALYESSRWTAAFIVPSVTNDSFIGVERDNFHKEDVSTYLSAGPGSYNPRVYFSTNTEHHIEWGSESRRLKWVSGGRDKHYYDFKVQEIEHQVALDHPVDDLNYKGYEVYRGTASYSIMSKSDDYMSTYYYYSDGFFSDDPSEYNDHLASLSMTAEIACSKETTYLPDQIKTAELDYSTKLTNIAQFFSDIGCNQQDIYTNDYYLIKPEEDSIGCAIGSKQLTMVDENGDSDDSYILMPIVVRGIGYEAEWKSNFTLGESGPHQGFSEAADKVLSSIDTYIYTHDLATKAREGKIKFWITGHSRAGATSNIAAKRMTDKYGESGNKIFCYTFEPPYCAPAGGSDLVNASYTYNGKYENIHNIINGADLVVHIPYYKMGFTRYGVSHYLPGSYGSQSASNDPEDDYTLPDTFDNFMLPATYYDKDSDYCKIRDKMVDQYYLCNPYEYYSDHIHSAIFSLWLHDLVLGDKIQEKGNMKDAYTFDRYFVSRLFEWSFLEGMQEKGWDLRKSYVTDIGHKVEDDLFTIPFQDAIGNALSVVMSLDPKASSAILGVLPNIINQPNIIELIRTILDDVRHYSDLSLPPISRLGSVSMLTLYLENTVKNVPEYRDLPETTKEKFISNVEHALYYLMFFVSKDFKSDGEPDWGMDVSDMYALPMIATAINSIGDLLQNHYPECSLAWVRACDSYYDSEVDGELGTDILPVKVNKKLHSEPTAPKLRYNGQEYTGFSEGELPTEPVDLIDTNTFQLFTEGNNGDVIYYNIAKTESPEDLADPRETWNSTHYQTNITISGEDPSPSYSIDLSDLSNGNDESYSIYTIAAVSLGFDQFSDVKYFQIKVHNGYSVTITSPAYKDVFGQETINKAIVEGSNVLLSTDAFYKGSKFSGWTVRNSAGNDITEVIFNSNDVEACNRNLSTTWVKMPNYSLKFDAHYSDHHDTINIIADNLNLKFGQNFPTEVEPTYVVNDTYYSPHKTESITWFKINEDGQESEILNPTEEVVEVNYAYKFILNIDLDKSCFELPASTSGIDVLINGESLDNNTYSIECDYHEDYPIWKLSYTFSREVTVLNQVSPYNFINIENQLDIEATIDDVVETVKSNLPDKAVIQTSRGDVEFDIKWDTESDAFRFTCGSFLEEKQFHTQIDFKTTQWVSLSDRELPDCFKDNEGRRVYLDIDAKVFAPARQQANSPSSDLAPGTYWTTEGDPIKLHLSNIQNLDTIKYTFDNPITQETVWNSYEDEIELSPTNTEIKITTYTDEGDISDTHYNKSNTQTYIYTINKKDSFKITASHVGPNDVQLSDDVEYPFMTNDAVTLQSQAITGYEFDHWENVGGAEIITDANKFMPTIMMTNPAVSSSIKAVYKPVIQSVEVCMDQPAVGANLAKNIKSISFVVPEGTVQFTEEQINQYVTLNWIHEKREITAEDYPVVASYDEYYIGSIHINSSFFQGKNYYFPKIMSVNIVSNSIYQELMDCASYSISRADDDDSINEYCINVQPKATPKPRLLLIGEVKDVKNIEHGLSPEDLWNLLPQTVWIVAEAGIIDNAQIEWNKEEASEYNPTDPADQVVSVPGEVIIPTYIDNGTEEQKIIPTAVSVKLFINGAEYCSTPTINPRTGSIFEENVTASLSTETKDSDIYYRVDTKTEIPNDAKSISYDEAEYIPYTGPFEITAEDQTRVTATIYCYCQRDDLRESPLGVYTLIVDKVYTPCWRVDLPSLTIPVYSTVKIEPTLTPSDTSDNKLDYSSSDETIAEVDSSGYITANGIGSCTITGTTRRGGTTGSTTINIIPLIYDFLETPNNIYTLTSNEIRQYIVGAESNRFEDVYVDGLKIDKSCYEYVLIPLPYGNQGGLYGEGSEPPYNPEIDTQTVVKILPQYLETLGLGDHNIMFKFNDGSASIQLNVVNPNTPSPIPGTGSGSSLIDAIAAFGEEVFGGEPAAIANINEPMSSSEGSPWLIVVAAILALVASGSVVGWRVYKVKKRNGKIKK